MRGAELEARTDDTQSEKKTTCEEKHVFEVFTFSFSASTKGLRKV